MNYTPFAYSTPLITVQTGPVRIWLLPILSVSAWTKLFLPFGGILPPLNGIAHHHMVWDYFFPQHVTFPPLFHP